MGDAIISTTVGKPDGYTAVAGATSSFQSSKYVKPNTSFDVCQTPDGNGAEVPVVMVTDGEIQSGTTCALNGAESQVKNITSGGVTVDRGTIYVRNDVLKAETSPEKPRANEKKPASLRDKKPAASDAPEAPPAPPKAPPAPTPPANGGKSATTQPKMENLPLTAEDARNFKAVPATRY